MHLPNAHIIAAALLISNPAYSVGDPSYNNNGVLTIPRVDTSAQVGQYQDIIFQYVSQGNWTISGLEALQSETGHLLQPPVSQVEVIKTGVLPVSVYLRASGVKIACGFTEPARVHQRLVGSRFDVDITVVTSVARVGGVAVFTCTASISQYKMTIPLQVYGLTAGTYSYNVNGIIGTFTLDSDNKLPDDCDAASNSIGPCQ